MFNTPRPILSLSPLSFLEVFRSSPTPTVGASHSGFLFLDGNGEIDYLVGVVLLYSSFMNGAL